MTENVPKLMSDTKPQIQGVNKVNGKTKQNKTKQKTEGTIEFFKRIINKKSISDIFVLKGFITGSKIHLFQNW